MERGNLRSVAAAQLRRRRRLIPIKVYDTAMATYRVVLRQSDEGYSVSCPGLPGCWSQGATEEEALTNIRVAIREYVDAAEDLARDSEGRMVEVAVA